MSVNQSKSVKNDLQYRKVAGGGRPGSSGQQRTFTGNSGKGGGGNSTAPPLVTSASSPSANQSFKEIPYAQGVQSRVLNAGPAPVYNGSHSQTQLSASFVNSKPNDTSARKSTWPIPRAPQASTMTSDSATTPKTPAKGEGAKGFPLQFGSISPGVVNGMQVPPRTTSAPPNLHEQERTQAHPGAQKGAAAISVVPVPMSQVPGNAVASIPRHATGQANADTKLKLGAPVTSASPSSQLQKPAVPPMNAASGHSMQMAYPQPSAPLHFGGPNQQMLSQGFPAPSLPMAMQMPIQMGNPSHVPQQVFMGLQHHMIPPQGIMHQNQVLGFNPQMGQLPHQLGNLGMNTSQQFPPQPANYGNTRRAVKITHPETHEELRLDRRNDVHTDGTSASRTHYNMPSQSYTSSFPVGYYSNSYDGPPPFPSPAAQMTAAPQQGVRITYPVTQQNVSLTGHSAPNSSVKKVGTVVHGSVQSSSSGSSRVAQNLSSSPSVPVTIKPAASSSSGKSMGSKPVDKDMTSTTPRPLPQFLKDYQLAAENHVAHSNVGSGKLKLPPASGQGNVSDGMAPSMFNASHSELLTTLSVDGAKRESVAKSDCVKENQKTPLMKGEPVSVHRVGVQSSVDMSSEAVEGGGQSFKMVSSTSVELKGDFAEAGPHETAETLLEQSSAAPTDDGGATAGAVFEAHAGSGSELVASGSVVTIDASNCSQRQDLPPQAAVLAAEKVTEKENLVEAKTQKCGNSDADSLNIAEIVDKSSTNPESKGNNCEARLVDATNETPDASLKTLSCSTGDGEVKKTSLSDHEGDAVTISVEVTEASSRPVGGGMETARPTSSSGYASSSSRESVESNKAKSTLARGKKKRKEILQKADAQGTASDLYMAYKGPEEKKEGILSTECTENTSSTKLHEDAFVKEEDDSSKAELDDWEDAADVSTPKLQSISDRNHVLAKSEGEEVGTLKKYSRDFLLTFSEQYTVLPDGFKFTSDVADILKRPNSSSSRMVNREFTGPARVLDRPSGGPKVDRRGSGMMGHDPGYGPMSTGFHPSQGGNYGVIRNPRAQQPVQYPIMSGPMHSMHHRNNTEADRWRSKVSMPSPMQAMHKAERKYEVGKVSDEEQAKQRKLKGILNKLTPQNFDKLFAQVREVNIDNVVTLNGVISQIFDKALMEPTFCEMYSNFCYQLSLALPELSVDDEKITFKRLLLNKCQEEFEKGEREEEEAGEVDNEDETKLSDKEREERRLQARRRMLGNIRLIGELYKKRMLTERIMHECIKQLFGQYPNSLEEDLESLCKLMSTIGDMIDHPKAKDHMDAYFDMMAKLSNEMKLSSRVRFMLKDVIDLRKNKWKQRMKVEGPKKIEDVHRDAAQERHAQTSRAHRGPNMGSGMRRGQGQPVDYGPRGSNMPSSPVGQTGNFHAPSPQVRSYGMQNAFDSRKVSVPLPQRPLGYDSITFGPQGGLAKGMSTRGQPSVSDVPSASLRGPTPLGRPGSSQSSMQDHRNADRSISAAPHTRLHGASPVENLTSERVWSEERLREKSIAAIKEFYSAKDEKEINTCVRELNAPNFYPSVVSIWVADSFERKNVEREMLNDLIINLSKLHDGQQLFTPNQLVKGFETVFAELEDTVSDAPKAPDYLGVLLARLIVENIVTLREISRLLYEGGDEAGRLKEEGLAGDVLGSILENIKSAKGESAVKEIWASSGFRLEDFRPSAPRKCKKLEMFI